MWSEDSDPADSLATMLDVYGHDMADGQAEHAEKHGIDDGLLGKIGELTNILLSNTQDLTSAALQEVQTLLQNVDESAQSILMHFALQRCQHSILRGDVDDAGGSAQRLINLLIASKPAILSTRCRTFLGRVSRCYMRGFHPECAIMCRAALEAQLDAEISNDLCVDRLGSRRPLYFSLADRIGVAKSCGYLDDELAASAREVKDLGNQAVHRNPVEIKDSLPLIFKTMSVLHALERRD